MNQELLKPGLEAAALWVDSRREDYDRDHGTTDHETGSCEYPGTGEEYVGELVEIAEGIRSLAPNYLEDGDLIDVVKRLARALEVASPGHALARSSMDFLGVHGVENNSLREPKEEMKTEDVPKWKQHDLRIKELMAGLGMPDSMPLYSAFKQFANELCPSVWVVNTPKVEVDKDPYTP